MKRVLGEVAIYADFITIGRGLIRASGFHESVSLLGYSGKVGFQVCSTQIDKQGVFMRLEESRGIQVCQSGSSRFRCLGPAILNGRHILQAVVLVKVIRGPNLKS